MKPTIHTVKTAKVNTGVYSAVTHVSQTEHDVLLNDLVGVSPVICSEYNSSANMTLTYNRQYNQQISIHFPLASMGMEARVELMKAWREFVAGDDTSTPSDLEQPSAGEPSPKTEAPQYRYHGSED